MMSSRSLCLAIAALALLAGCTDEPAEKAAAPAPQPVSTPAPVEPQVKRAVPRPVAASTEQSAAADAYLRSVMPADAFAYVRVPGIWSMLGARKGTIYDQAVGSAPYVSAVNAIREGVGADMLPELPAEIRSVAGLVAVHLRSPLEAVVLPGASPELPVPSLLLSAVVDVSGVDAFRALVEDIAQRVPDIELMSPVDANGNGMIVAGDAPLALHYAAAASRLYVHAGLQPDPVALAALVAGLSANPAHPMLAAEPAIDSSGQGMFAWVDPKPVLELMENMGQAQQAMMLTAFGAGEMESLTVGLGSTRGGLRLKLAAKMPQVGFRAYTPVMRYELGLEAAGHLDMAFVLGLPSAEDAAGIEQAVLANVDAGDRQSFLEGKQLVQEKLGVTLEELLGIFGQELVVVFDEAGQYAGIRVRNPDALEKLLQRQVAEFGFKRDEREIAGRRFTHLVLPSMAERFAPDDEPVEPLLKRFMLVPSHIYYTLEDDYLLFSSAPQSLIDREYIEQRTPVGQWLVEQQRVDPNGAVFLASVRNPGVPALMYEFNLQLLVALGDIAGRPVDLFAFPTARELELPEEGAYSLRLASTDDELSVELAFENNPAEFMMMSSGYTGIALLGVMAAVAVPAYNDYTTRASVAAAGAASAAARIEVERFVLEFGRLPDESDTANFQSTAIDRSVSIQAGDQEVSVRVSVGSSELAPPANELRYVGVIRDGAVRWRCESAMASKFLPRDCR